MIVACLIGVITAAVALDFELSRRRINQFGASIEHNPLVRAELKTGSSAGISLLFGAVVPSAIITALCAIFSPVALAMFAGIRADRALLQLESLSLDKHLAESRAKLKAFIHAEYERGKAEAKAEIQKIESKL